MLLSFRKLLLALLCFLPLAAHAQVGEAQVGFPPFTDLLIVSYNKSFSIVSTPTPLMAGMYQFCGAYYMKAAAGTTLSTYHADIGLDPDNIDTAPAGGSSNGHHIPIAGDDAGVLTYVEPVGCRNLLLDGNSKVYLHLISSFIPSTAIVKAGAVLNWHRIQ